MAGRYNTFARTGYLEGDWPVLIVVEKKRS